MEKPQLFVAFKPADKKCLADLVGWDVEQVFDYQYLPEGIPLVAFHSQDGAILKDDIKEQLRKKTHLLVIVGKDTANNDWINHMIQTASVIGKKVVGVKLNMNCKAPAAALNYGAAWAKSFAWEPIKLVIERGEGGSDEIVEGAKMGGMMEG